MLDHIFLTVGDIELSIAFYSATLQPLGITQRLDYDGKDGPPGHPDLKGFGARGRMFFWLRAGQASPGRFTSGSSPTLRRWSMPRTPPPSLRAVARYIRRVRSFTTIPATMRRRSQILTATPSSSSSRAGNTGVERDKKRGQATLLSV